jgi:ribosomal protein L11 methyltransferase
VTAVAEHPSWVELVVETGEEASEALTNFLWELGAVGVVEESLGGAPGRLHAFYPSGTDPNSLATRVNVYLDGLRALGLDTGVLAQVAPLADTDWNAAWREHFRPLPVGRRLVVAPPWDVPAASERLVLVIEPGRPFGTGHHGTTAGCLTLLETLIARDLPTRALDLGTGSGILAVAAARLGVGEIVACDSDTDAVAAAEGNAHRNGVAGHVHALLADAATLTVEPAPLVLANLLAAAHRGLARRYRDLVAPSGALVLGGLLDPEADSVADALAAHGFTWEASVSLEGWTSLALRHAPLHASA